MKIGKLWIGIDRSKKIDDLEFATVDEEYEKSLESGKKLILGTLVARSGTRWLGDVFDEHDNATGVTERDAGSESFYRYVKYNDLPIDTAGVIKIIKKGIVDDWENGDVAFVNSPYFSHGFVGLYEALRPEKVVFGLNDPEFTVQSIYNKGLFRERYIRDRVDYALGFQPALKDEWSHFFGRVVPNGEFYNEWLDLTRIGKIAWWGNRIAMDIYEQLQDIPQEKLFIFHLKEAEENYKYYKEKLVRVFGLEPTLGEKKFLSIRGKTFRESQNVHHEWTQKERKEFDHHTKEWHGIYKKLCL